MTKNSSNAFTFIEILVVTAIISLLTSGSAVTYTSFSKQSRDARRKVDLEQIRSALENYKSNREDGTYPASLSFGNGSISDGANVYLNKIPQDPKAGLSYTYKTNELKTSFALSAAMEDDTIYCITLYGQSFIPKSQQCNEFTIQDQQLNQQNNQRGPYSGPYTQ